MDGKSRRHNADILVWARFLEIPSLQQCLLPESPGKTTAGVKQNHKLFLRKEDKNDQFSFLLNELTRIKWHCSSKLPG